MALGCHAAQTKHGVLLCCIDMKPDAESIHAFFLRQGIAAVLVRFARRAIITCFSPKRQWRSLLASLKRRTWNWFDGRQVGIQDPGKGQSSLAGVQSALGEARIAKFLPVSIYFI